MLVSATHPRSRGRLTLRSSDPLGAPRIDAGYFSEPSDLEAVKQGLRAVFEIADHQPLKANLGALRLPDRVPDDAALTRTHPALVTNPIPPGRDLRDGRGCRFRRRPRTPGARSRQSPGDRRLRDAVHHRRQHQRDHHHDRRKGRRSSAGQSFWRVAISREKLGYRGLKVCVFTDELTGAGPPRGQRFADALGHRAGVTCGPRSGYAVRIAYFV